MYFFVLPICIYLQLNKNNKSAILFPTLSPENYFVLVCGLPCVCPAVSALSMSWVVFSVIVSGLSVKCDYYSFNIFPQLWLAKSTRIIHHNQLLMTKFERILCLTRKWRQKCSLLQVKAPLTEKAWGRDWVADTSLVSRVRTVAGTRRNDG